MQSPSLSVGQDAHREEDVRLFLQSWVGQNKELTQAEASKLWADQFQPSRFDVIWSHLLTRGLLSAASRDRFLPSLDAVQWANKSTDRFSIEEGRQAVSLLMTRIHAWNNIAHANEWPSVAAVAVWGSLARPGSKDCGDADIALIWRRPHEDIVFSQDPHPGSSLFEKLSSANVEKRLKSLDRSSMGDIEEAAEEWFSQIPLISLSGVDQWDDLRILDPSFAAASVWQDEFWGTDKEVSGLKSWECQAFSNINCHWGPASSRKQAMK